MTYEKTPVTTKPSKTAVNKAVKEGLNEISTSRLVWHLLRKHHVAILALYAVWLSVAHFAPTLPATIFSMFR